MTGAPSEAVMPPTLSATTFSIPPSPVTAWRSSASVAASASSETSAPTVRPSRVGFAFTRMLSVGEGGRSVRALTVVGAGSIGAV